MLVLQTILYCLLYILLVKCAVKNSGLNCLYFYPEEYIDEAQPRCCICSLHLSSPVLWR